MLSYKMIEIVHRFDAILICHGANQEDAVGVYDDEFRNALCFDVNH